MHLTKYNSPIQVSKVMEAKSQRKTKMWEEVQVPSEGEEGYLIKLPKKGDPSSSSSYGGITLLLIPSKVFSRVLLNRKKYKIMQLTSSFRTNRTSFAGAGSAQIRLQHCAPSHNSHANGTPLSTSTLLIMRGIDSLDRQSLRKRLRHYGVPEKITSII